jgi:hypothetical protein
MSSSGCSSSIEPATAARGKRALQPHTAARRSALVVAGLLLLSVALWLSAAGALAKPKPKHRRHRSLSHSCVARHRHRRHGGHRGRSTHRAHSALSAHGRHPGRSGRAVRCRRRAVSKHVNAPRTTVTGGPTTGTGPNSGSSTPPSGGSPPHMMLMLFENRSRGEVIGNGEWPYLNELASRYGNTTSWAGVSHPSEPNYLALISGSTQGVTGDLCGISFSTETLPAQLTRAGLGWRAYMEDMPEPGSLVCTLGLYAEKHNPFAFFPAVNGPAVVPAGEGASVLKSDLANGSAPPFIWLTPNLCNDVHNCSGATGDNYLRGLVPSILASKWYAEDGTVIVTFDEDEGENKIATVVLHGSGAHTTLDAAGNHCGTLATIEDAYKLPRLGCAQGATTLTPLIE